MSYCRKEGKDQIIFVTKDDYSKQTVENPLLPGDEEPTGLIKDNGDINWDCPCLQGMADGPCGQEFKDAFSCFHYSEAEPKGVDCLEQFKSMQNCFVKYPEVYGSLDDDLKDEEHEESTRDDDKNTEPLEPHDTTARNDTDNNSSNTSSNDEDVGKDSIS